MQYLHRTKIIPRRISNIFIASLNKTQIVPRIFYLLRTRVNKYNINLLAIVFTYVKSALYYNCYNTYV